MKYEKPTIYDECSICLQKYNNGDQIFITKCQHKYHIQCLLSWYKNNNNCPICRKQICINSIIQKTIQKKTRNKSICFFSCIENRKFSLTKW